MQQLCQWPLVRLGSRIRIERNLGIKMDQPRPLLIHSCLLRSKLANDGQSLWLS